MRKLQKVFSSVILCGAAFAYAEPTTKPASSPADDMGEIAKETRSPDDVGDDAAREMVRNGTILKFKMDPPALYLTVSQEKWDSLTHDQHVKFILAWGNWYSTKLLPQQRKNLTVALRNPHGKMVGFIFENKLNFVTD